MLFQANVRAHADSSSFEVGSAVIFVNDRGIEDGAAMDFVWETAHSRALEQLWDDRLDATGNTPNVELSVCASWVLVENYAFAAAGQVRFFFDVRLKCLLGLASHHEGAWLPLSVEQAQMLEEEVKATGLYASPESWQEGVAIESWRELPVWAQAVVGTAMQ